MLLRSPVDLALGGRKKQSLIFFESRLPWSSLNESPAVGALVRAIGNGLTRIGRADSRR